MIDSFFSGSSTLGIGGGGDIFIVVEISSSASLKFSSSLESLPLLRNGKDDKDKDKEKG